MQLQIIKDAPWELSDEFLLEHKIDFVAHDEIPYTSDDTHDIYALIKERGMFVATERTEGKYDAVIERISINYSNYYKSIKSMQSLI